jgi:hypothetical protein
MAAGVAKATASSPDLRHSSFAQDGLEVRHAKGRTVMSLKLAIVGILPALGAFGAPVQAGEQIPGLGLSSPPEMAARLFAAEPYKPEAAGRVIRRVMRGIVSGGVL